jgi:hypothetical protein
MNAAPDAHASRPRTQRPVTTRRARGRCVGWGLGSENAGWRRVIEVAWWMLAPFALALTVILAGFLYGLVDLPDE